MISTERFETLDETITYLTGELRKSILNGYVSFYICNPCENREVQVLYYFNDPESDLQIIAEKEFV